MSDALRSFDVYSYKDYETWPDYPRYELIDGIAYMMAPPSLWHQEMVLELGSQLKEFFRDKDCKPYVSPVGVRLFPEENGSDDRVVVQPDLMVVCDKKKLSDGKTCLGPPDLIIEILSENKSHDLIYKYNLYKQAGIREYWIVGEDAVKVCQFQSDGKVNETVYDFDENSREIESAIFPGLVLRF